MNRGSLPADIRDSSQLWTPPSPDGRLWSPVTAEYSPRLALRFSANVTVTSLRHVPQAMRRMVYSRHSFIVLCPYSPVFIRSY